MREIFSHLPPTVKFTMISDCCHSGSMLDHLEQQISGDKDPSAAPGVDQMNPTDLMGAYFKGAEGHRSSHKYGALHALADATKVLIGSGHTRSQAFNGNPTKT
jgi:hypothetical protein